MRLIRFSEKELVPASHEDAAEPGVWKKVLLSRPELSRGVVQMINWAVLPHGRRFQAHYHEDMEEVFIMTRGRAAISINDETALLESGDAVIIPARSIHVMENACDGDAEYIAIGISQGKGGKTVVV